MSQTTITEALAELKTIKARISKKEIFILSFLVRQDLVRDPHEKDGGSASLIARERQSINDLQKRFINLRSAIQRSNLEKSLTLRDSQGRERTDSVANWLIWRRDLLDEERSRHTQWQKRIMDARQQVQQKGGQLLDRGSEQPKATDFVVNMGERELADSIESIEEYAGQLDGKLSLVNATTTLNVED